MRGDEGDQNGNEVGNQGKGESSSLKEKAIDCREKLFWPNE